MMITNGGRNCRMFYQSDATLKHMLQMLQRYFPLVPVINLQVATNTNTHTNTKRRQIRMLAIYIYKEMV